jgi:hypothetical protein
MNYSEDEFDLVIDKGTLDALLYDDDFDFTDKMLFEMNRVLNK